MFGALRFGIRAFFLGLVLGLLIAPRPGSETRRLLRDRFVQIIDALTEILALPEEPMALPERGQRIGVRGAQHG
jgi:predicted lipid-binding transport protein (Tim44 family)